MTEAAFADPDAYISIQFLTDLANELAALRRNQTDAFRYGRGVSEGQQKHRLFQKIFWTP